MTMNQIKRKEYNPAHEPNTLEESELSQITYLGQVLTIEDLAKLDKKELIEIRSSLDLTRVELKLKLNNAATHFYKTGERADSDWYQRTDYKYKRLGIQIQAICKVLSDLKTARQESAMKGSEQSSFADRFVRIAYTVLKPETFEKIKELANGDIE